jgi:hypothetical protein
MAAMAHLTPPEGFFPLTEMLNLPMQKSFNVCGIVTDTRPPGPTRGLGMKVQHVLDNLLFTEFDYRLEDDS